MDFSFLGCARVEDRARTGYERSPLTSCRSATATDNSRAGWFHESAACTFPSWRGPFPDLAVADSVALVTTETCAWSQLHVGVWPGTRLCESVNTPGLIPGSGTRYHAHSTARPQEIRTHPALAGRARHGRTATSRIRSVTAREAESMLTTIGARQTLRTAQA
jgi:hypothetical protein